MARILKLEHLQTMDIDEILNLYIQGYSLEESPEKSEYIDLNNSEIVSLSAFPSIYNDAGFKSFSTTSVLILFKNVGLYGYVGFRILESGSEIGSKEMCYSPTIGDLYSLERIDISSLHNSYYIQVYNCTTQNENCTAGTCLDPILIGATSSTNTILEDLTIPSAPANLTVTPADKSLNISWSPVSGSIFCYDVTIWDPTGYPTVSGHTLPTVSSITVGGLTNGTTYTVEVNARTTSDYQGTISSKPGTPAVPTVSSITISPSVATVPPGSTLQLTPTCIDVNNISITCPTLSWSSDNTSVATVSQTGLVTGVSTGSANITASVSGIMSNKSLIGVATPVCPCPPCTPNYWVCCVSTVGKTVLFTATCTGTVSIELHNSTTGALEASGSFPNGPHSLNATTYGAHYLYVPSSSCYSGSPSGRCDFNIPSPLAKIHFTVKDSVTNNPIQGVSVYIDNILQTTTTNSTGEFTTADLSTETVHSYKLSKTGYVDKTKTGIALTPGQTLDENVAMDPTILLKSISIYPSTTVVSPGGNRQFNAACMDQNGITIICPTPLIWTVDDTTIGTISSSGLFTASSKTGSTYVKATYGNVQGLATVTVSSISTLNTITISPSTATIGIGGTAQLTAICKDQNNLTINCPTFTWTSNNTSKATVNSSGKVTGVSEGIANITARASGIVSNSSQVTVTTVTPSAGGGMGLIALVGIAAAAMFMLKPKI